MSAATQSQKAIRVQEMKPEQRNMTLQFLPCPNKITGCTGWPEYSLITFVGMINAAMKSKPIVKFRIEL